MKRALAAFIICVIGTNMFVRLASPWSWASFAVGVFFSLSFPLAVYLLEGITRRAEGGD